MSKSCVDTVEIMFGFGIFEAPLFSSLCLVASVEKSRKKLPGTSHGCGQHMRGEWPLTAAPRVPLVLEPQTFSQE